MGQRISSCFTKGLDWILRGPQSWARDRRGAGEGVREANWRKPRNRDWQKGADTKSFINIALANISKATKRLRDKPKRERGVYFILGCFQKCQSSFGISEVRTRIPSRNLESSAVFKIKLRKHTKRPPGSSRIIAVLENTGSLKHRIKRMEKRISFVLFCKHPLKPPEMEALPCAFAQGNWDKCARALKTSQI